MLKPPFNRGPIIVTIVPIIARLIPSFSCFVIFSLRNHTPNSAVIKGDMAEISIVSNIVVLSIPKKSNPKEIVVENILYKKTRGKLLNIFLR
jgi:hypothetical protein